MSFNCFSFTSPNPPTPTSTLIETCTDRVQPKSTSATKSFRKIHSFVTTKNTNQPTTIIIYFVVSRAALQQWTPCLPIRGGKLKASKPFSTSNPQLPFICPTSSTSNYAGPPNQSLNSLNSSFIWREATPNNFNLYSASIPSLNSYRYSSQPPPPQPKAQQQHQAQSSGFSGPSSLPNARAIFQREPRAHSEDRGLIGPAMGAATSGIGIPHKTPSPSPATPTPFQQVCKYKTASNYDNLYITSCNTPLLTRKNSTQQLMAQRYSNASSARTNYQNYPFPPGTASTVSGAMCGSPYLYSGGFGQSSYIPRLLASGANNDTASTASRGLPHSYQPPTTPQQAFLYDRRVNRSFDSPQEFARGSKVGPLRRSTPHLVVSDNDEAFSEDPYLHKHHYYPPNYHQPGGDQDHLPADSSRNSINSTSWCCGNMFKHWRKYHNYE